MKMNFLVLALMLMVGVTSPTIAAAEWNCPQALAPTPAVVTFGPYQIQGYGTSTATAIGLPDCASVNHHVDQMLAAAGQPAAVITITAEQDGTYTAHIEDM